MTTTEGTQEQTPPVIPPNNEASVAGTLARLTVEAKQEMQKLASGDFSTQIDLFSWYKTTPRFAEVYQEASRFELNPRTDDERKSNSSKLAGRIFQDLGYFFLVKREIEKGSSLVILTPEQTLELWQSIFPRRTTSQNPFSINSIMGKHVPDMVIIDPTDNSIVALCESTLTDKEESVKARTEGIAHSKADLRELGTKAKFILVTPIPFIKKENLGFDENIQLPINHYKFRSFINGIYNDYRPNEDSETLREIRARVMEQAEQTKLGDPFGITTRGYKGKLSD